MSNFDSPILITGVPRSRTSLVAGILDKCGAFGGETCGPTPHNKLGQFENVDIIRNITKDYLINAGYDKLGQKNLPESSELLIERNWRNKIHSILVKHGYDESYIWYHKDPKICLLWPIWENQFPQSTWLITKRKREEIIESCSKVTFLRNLKTRKEIETFVEEYFERLEEIKNNCSNVFEINTDKIVEEDFSQIKEIIEKFDLSWDNKIINFVRTK